MRILAVSPHYDDVPLSLGQSLLDGVLADHEVTVGVVFGRSNFTRWFHPTRTRWPLATAIRRAEERWNAVRFGYRTVIASREEALLRLGTTDTAVFLDPGYDPTGSAELDPVVRLLARWADGIDLVLCPLGVGGHVDHLIAAEAGRRLAAQGVPVGYYADRPYATFVTDDEVATLAPTGWTGVEASGPISRTKTRRLFYPSQFDPLFVDAQRADEDSRRHELVYLPDPTLLERAGSSARAR
jgi:LmbE family N-acetylglucosaminyl deacetylase